VKKPRALPTVAAAVRLPRSSHEWLRKRPEGITDGIKRGLELLAVADGLDERTRRLAEAIGKLARDIELETGAAWHEDRGAFRTLRTAILSAMSSIAPKGIPTDALEHVKLRPFEEREHASHSSDDPQEVGMWLALDVLQTPNDQGRAVMRAGREETLKAVAKARRDRGED
jgi:hypothetical protein